MSRKYEYSVLQAIARPTIFLLPGSPLSDSDELLQYSSLQKRPICRSLEAVESGRSLEAVESEARPSASSSDH